jgi:hypothetical protein
VNGDLPASFIATGLVTFSVDAFPFYILAWEKIERWESPLIEKDENIVSYSGNN